MLISHSERVVDTPAFALIAEGWNELVQDGLTPKGNPLSPLMAGDEVLYALGDDPDDVIGVLVYSTSPLFATVEFAYVETSSRRRGIFKALLGRLAATVAPLGIAHIDFADSNCNAPFKEVLKHLGGPVLGVVPPTSNAG